MTTQAASQPDLQRSAVARSLLVVWQDPADRRFVPIAELSHLNDGRYVFQYSDAARVNSGFFALDEYPDLSRTYVSDSLPVFFTNRVMTAGRPSYDRYLHWLGIENLQSSEVPLEVLARTGGGRATDTFHIVDRPLKGERAFSSRFFVSGIRHVENPDDALAKVRPGDRLELRRQPDNAKNPKAVIIDVETGVQLGWVPDWLCGEVTDLLTDGWSLTLTAEQVNLDAPAHTRVLCLLTADLATPSSSS